MLGLKVRGEDVSMSLRNSILCGDYRASRVTVDAPERMPNGSSRRIRNWLNSHGDVLVSNRQKGARAFRIWQKVRAGQISNPLSVAAINKEYAAEFKEFDRQSKRLVSR